MSASLAFREAATLNAVQAQYAADASSARLNPLNPFSWWALGLSCWWLTQARALVEIAGPASAHPQPRR